jgi:hypothetical protein
MTALQHKSRATGRSVAIDAATPRLILRHPVFATFHDPFFRISEVEQRPVLVILMDDREVSLPLNGMMREFGISPLDADGVMLAMVARALEFLTGMRIGDRMPSEILTGEASWIADEAYQDRAIARLNLQLLAWMSGTVCTNTREMLSRAGQMPMSAEILVAGLRRLSAQIGGITAEDALTRIRRVAGEFAHIDALRDQLLRGAQRLGTVLDRLARTFRGDVTHKELLMQLRRLASIGIADLQARFDATDLLVADITEVVGRPDATVIAIRKHRDGLYVRCRAWEPYSIEWGTIEAGHNARTWHLAYDTYRFLAPRFMTTVEWLTTPDASAAARLARSGMVW